MAPQLVKMGWGWGESGPDPSLSTRRILFPLAAPENLPSLTGEGGWVLLLRKGQVGLG